MKRGIIIGIVVVVLLIVLGIYFYSGKGTTPTDCANVGEEPFTSKPCCDGLKEVVNANLNMYDEHGVLITGFAFPFVCVNCGNDSCDNLEHKFNCPEDCS